MLSARKLKKAVTGNKELPTRTTPRFVDIMRNVYLCNWAINTPVDMFVRAAVLRGSISVRGSMFA